MQRVCQQLSLLSKDNLVLKYVSTQIDWLHHHLWERGDRLVVDMQAAYPGTTLWCMLRGSVELSIAGRHLLVEEGSIALIPPLLERELITREGAEWLSIGLSATLFGRTTLLNAVDLPVLWSSDDTAGDSASPSRAETVSAVREIMLLLERECADPGRARTTPSSISRPMLNLTEQRSSRNGAYLMMMAGSELTLLSLCWRMLGRENISWFTTLNLPAWLVKTLSRIDESPDISLQQLIEDACVSPAQIRREFHKWTGMSPQSYLTAVRLERARTLLGATDLLVSSVAEIVGFESVSHFTLLFKKKFQQTPHRYRLSAIGQEI